jgi:hypothetical protein
VIHGAQLEDGHLLAKKKRKETTKARHRLGSPHTRDREPVTITLQALSLVEKAKLVQVRFTLRLRDQQSM